MIRNWIFILALVAAGTLHAQNNFVTGKVIFINGEVDQGYVDDRFWKDSPEFIEYKNSHGEMTKLYPQHVREVTIESKAVYRSFLVNYDSSARKSNELSTGREPMYKRAYLFLKLLGEADIALLISTINGDERYFIQRDNEAEELVNHPFQNSLGGQEIKLQNRLYVKQLTEALAGCAHLNVDARLPYEEKHLKMLLSEYATCVGKEIKFYEKKEKSVIRKGVVSTLSYDLMIKNFKGGIGTGLGGFVTCYFPKRVYKYSLYGDLTYSHFGNQVWSGVDYVGFPYRETHKLRSIKSTITLRSRVSKKPALPHPGYAYIGTGCTVSFGLKDSYQRGKYSAQSAVPFMGVLANAGVYLNKNFILDLKIEKGTSISYGDYVIQDNRPPLSKGYYSFQCNLLVEF
jgi:hypothetical protein